jgi:hypothetical protein
MAGISGSVSESLRSCPPPHSGATPAEAKEVFVIQRGSLLVGMCLMALGPGFAQRTEPLFSGVATFDNGLIVRYSTMADSPFADSDLAGWGSGEVVSEPSPAPTPGTGDQKLQRFIVDSRRRIYFGYNLRVVRQSVLVPAAGEPRSGVKARPYQVWIEPLTLAPHDLPEHFRNAHLRPAKLRAYPQSRMVGDGDSIVVDLSLSSRGGTSDASMRLRESVRFSTAGVRHLPVGGG